MNSRLLRLLFALAATLAAKEPLDICGTWVGRAQQETFLHARHLLARAVQPRAQAAPYRQDFGDVAVMDDSGGLVGRRNPFNLDRMTVAFAPSAGGYGVELAGDTFDAAGSQNGSRIDLADDDTRRIDLPFAFRFYGVDYRQLWVNSNGTVSFGAGDTDYSGTYGHFLASPPTIAACFTDLDPSSQTGSGVRVLADASRVAITWASVPLADSQNFGSVQVENFQIRLYPSGRIEFAYRSTRPPNALVGITPGGFKSVDLVDFATAPAGTFTNGIAETFSAADAIDVTYAAQRFYETHDDAYDYLVFYNASNIVADQGVVAYELTTRSHGEGYGDTPVEIGVEFGSPKRLKAVLNMGPLGQYPLNPSGTVAARVPIGDTPLTLLGHEAGHLFLALVSVADPSDPSALPMLGQGNAHWSFPFNSDASFLGGERIVDHGAGVVPRFETTATVMGYSALDQYLMGFRAPEDVPPTFLVTNSGQAPTRTPQVGVMFTGNRRDVAVEEIAARYGRRTPDSTVAQRRFRFGFVLIVPAGTAASAVSAGVAQVEEYRQAFDAFYDIAAGGRAIADTSLRRSVTLSLAPAAGLLEGGDGLAAIELGSPADTALTFKLHKPYGVVLAPASITIPAGASRVTFPIYGARRGVEEFSAEPGDATYETAVARVQVNPLSALHLALVSSDPLKIAVQDQNKLPYAGVRVNGIVSAADGSVALQWPASQSSISFALSGSAPTIDAVVNGASFEPRLGVGAFVTIFGQHLIGAQVKVGDAAVTPVFVSDTQVNFLAPANLPPGAAVVSIETAAGIALSRVRFERYAPGIFGVGISNGLARIYATGVGGAVTAQLDGVDVPVLDPGVRTLSPGVEEVDIRLPTLPGMHSVTLTIDGVVSNRSIYTFDPGN